MMEEERFTNSERFVFCRNNYTGKMELKDCSNHFSPVELTDELAKVLSKILYEHYSLVKEKESDLFELNNLVDFVKENSDLDKDVLIALIRWGR